MTEWSTDVVVTVEHAGTTVHLVCSEGGIGTDVWTVVERIASALVAVGFSPDKVIEAMETIRESDFADRFGGAA